MGGQLTKRAIAEEMRKLLLEKPLDKITVNDLTSPLGLNRQTFYYHFTDLGAVVEYIVTSDAEAVLYGKDDASNWQEGFLSILKLIKKDRKYIENIYHSLSRDQLERYLYRVVYPLMRKVVDEIGKGKNVEEEEKDFVANFYKFAFCGLTLDWIGRGLPGKEEDIVNHLSLLVEGTIEKALEAYSND